MDTSQRVALVLGGCGNVGSGVVFGFLRRGYGRVVVVSRDPARIHNLTQAIGEGKERILPIIGDVSNEDSAAATCATITQQCQRVDDIVLCVGMSWWQKGLIQGQTKHEMESMLNSLVVAPFVAYKAFINLVKSRPDTSFTFVTGGGADMYLVPGTGFMTVGGAASQGLARACLKEHIEDPVCVTEVSFLLGVTPVPEQMPQAFTWIFNKDAGEAISLVAMMKKGRGKTSTVMTLDHLKTLAQNGVL